MGMVDPAQDSPECIRGAKRGYAGTMRPSPSHLPILLAGCLAFVGPARPAPAQEADPDTAAARLALLEVTVTRLRATLGALPWSVSIVSPEIGDVPGRAVSLEETLRGVPGVFAQDRRNFALGDRLTIRGAGARAQFGVRGVQVILDEIPLTLPDGQSALGNLDLPTAGRIEVIRGPASALYGNAAGGVLRVWTREPADASLALASRLTLGSYGFLGTRLEASGRAGGVGWLASFRRVETDGFRTYADAERWNANLVGRADVSPATELRAVLNLSHLPFAENPSSVDRETARADPRSVRSSIVEQGAGERHAQGQAGVTVRHRRSGGPEWTATAWGLGRDVWNPIPATIIDLSRRAAGLRLEVRGVVGGTGPDAGAADGTDAAMLRWVAGLDAALQDDGRIEYENLGLRDGDEAVAGETRLDQEERVSSLGPFVQLLLEPAPRWSLTVAGRYDLNDFEVTDRRLADGDDSGDRTFSRFSPTVGVSFRPADALSAYASFATAFETPTTSELSNDPTGRGGFNRELRPEVLRSFELGLRGRLAGVNLSWGLAAYRGTVDDALIPFEGEDEVVFYRNAGRVSRDGLEAELAWTPASEVELSAAYTFQDFVFDRFTTDAGDFSGNREPGVPRHRLSLAARAELPGGLRAEADARWVDAFPVDDANQFSNWSYGVVDLGFARELRVGRFRPRPFLRVENLLDERHNASVVPNAFADRYYEPAPGRSLVVGLRVALP